MGWLGWTEAQTLATSMQAIEAAYRGRVKMIQAMTGRTPAPTAAPTQGGVHMTPLLFDALFGGN